VFVVDPSGGPICDATVVASDGKTEKTLSCLGVPDCVCVGVSERRATFHVIVTKAGYQTAETTA
jgi:hypothetical protein